VQITEKIIEIVCSNIATMSPEFVDVDADLSQMGMDSIVFIKIVLTLEGVFEIEFPDEYLIVSVTNSINKMVQIVLNEIKKSQ